MKLLIASKKIKNILYIIYIWYFQNFQNIEYVETDKINDNDKEIECSTYDVLFENIDTKYHTIVFGKCVYDNQSKGYVHFPIYLVNNDEVVEQIGVFECEQEKLPMILDEDGDIEPEYFTKPLLYEFVNKPFLEKYEAKTEEVVVDESPDGKLDEKELDIEELEDDVFSVKESNYVPKPKTYLYEMLYLNMITKKPFRIYWMKKQNSMLKKSNPSSKYLHPIHGSKNS